MVVNEPCGEVISLEDSSESKEGNGIEFLGEEKASPSRSDGIKLLGEEEVQHVEKRVRKLNTEVWRRKDAHCSLASRETVPLKNDFWKKKTGKKSEYEKELDLLWGEMDMSLGAEEMGAQLVANAPGSTDHNNVKPFTGTNTPKTNPEQPRDAECQLPKCSEDVPKPESPSMLPRDFCDDSGKIRTRSVSKVSVTMDPPKEQEHWESNNDSARMKSKVSPSPVEVLSGRPRKTKPTKFVLNQTSNPSSTPHRSKRIKHVADKTSKTVPEVSSSDELMKGHTAENSQVDGKEVSSDLDALVIYKPQKRSSGQTSKSQKQISPTEPSTAAISSSTTSSPPQQDHPTAVPTKCSFY